MAVYSDPSTSWRAQARHPRLAVLVQTKAWMAGPPGQARWHAAPAMTGLGRTVKTQGRWYQTREGPLGRRWCAIQYADNGFSSFGYGGREWARPAEIGTKDHMLRHHRYLSQPTSGPGTARAVRHCLSLHGTGRTVRDLIGGLVQSVGELQRFRPGSAGFGNLAVQQPQRHGMSRERLYPEADGIARGRGFEVPSALLQSGKLAPVGYGCADERHSNRCVAGW